MSTCSHSFILLRFPPLWGRRHTGVLLHLCLRDWSNEDLTHVSLNKTLTSPGFIFPNIYPDWRLSWRRASPCQSTYLSPRQRAKEALCQTSRHPQHRSSAVLPQVSPRPVLSSPGQTAKEKEYEFSFPLCFCWQGFFKCPSGHGRDPTSTQLWVPLSELRQSPGSCLGHAVQLQMFSIWEYG